MKYAVKLFLLLAVIFLPICGAAAKEKPIVAQPSSPSVQKATPALEKSSDMTIMGAAVANEQQAVTFIKKYAPDAKLNCSIEEIVRLYYKEAAFEGIRPDIALSQALLETGFFRYGGDVKAWQNNFCGLGSVGGGAKGATFSTPELGVRAHIQHLLVYSSKQRPKTTIVDPRYEMASKLPHIYGVCKTWRDLDGRWAAKGVPYGERVLNVHWRMLQIDPGPKSVEKPAEQPASPEAKDDKGPVREKVDKILKENKKK